MSQAAREHPSNVLYRGEITDFLAATYQLDEALRFEARFLDEPPGTVARLHAVIAQARAIYQRHLQDAMTAAADEMQAVAETMPRESTADPWIREQMELLADACRTGDMTRLAI